MPQLAKEMFYNLLSNVGGAAVHSQYPNDFEYYMVGLELVKYNGITIDMLIFPVLPNQIRRSEHTMTNVKRTMGGVSVTKTSSFIPIDFSLNGNFGRKFKILTQSDIVIDFQALNYSLKYHTTQRDYVSQEKMSGSKFSKPAFNYAVKTGYGVTKILEAIVNKSRGSIDNKPNRLIFYNLAFGESYLVEVIDFDINQGVESNMIWNYSLSMKAVSPLEMVEWRRERSLKSVLASSVVQKEVNRTASIAKKLIKNYV